jgi:uncharacterized protein (TIGR03089 family)
VTTFPGLLADLLRREPGRPLVTFYDDASGERIELSVTTYANWVAKTASLLVEEFDAERGETVRLDLPTHWLGPVFLGAAWTVGLQVVFEGAGDIVVCGPQTVEDWADHPRGIACSLRPLGVRFAEPPPGQLRDFGIEVWSQPDAFVPWDPPTDDDLALDGVAQAALIDQAHGGELEEGVRLMVTANPASPTGFAAFVEPCVRGGSTILVAHANPLTWATTFKAERATSGALPGCDGEPGRSWPLPSGRPPAR